MFRKARTKLSAKILEFTVIAVGVIISAVVVIVVILSLGILVAVFIVSSLSSTVFGIRSVLVVIRLLQILILTGTMIGHDVIFPSEIFFFADSSKSLPRSLHMAIISHIIMLFFNEMVSFTVPNHLLKLVLCTKFLSFISFTIVMTL